MTQILIRAEMVDDDVIFYAEGDGALAWAKHEGTLAGSRWEGLEREDPNFAYAAVTNEKGLEADVEKELASYIEAGKVVMDWSEYTEPE